MKRKPSCIDVAERAGVSTATVSYVFNGRKNATVPDATRQRVLEAAEMIGYRPNRLAKSLVSGKTHLVGMVTRLDYQSFDIRIAAPAQVELTKRGYQILLAHNHTHWELEQNDIHVLLDHQVDALVCISGGWARPDRPLVDCVLEYGIPCVIVNDRETTGQIDSIVSDNRKGASAVVDHLVSKGHRRIALASSDDRIFTSRERRRGYLDALQAAGIEPDAGLICGDQYSAKCGYEVARRFLGQENRPTAIFGANDAIAAGAYQAAVEMGLRIPEDVAIAGYGNERESEALMMTSVDQQPDQMARMAIERLFERMEEPAAQADVRVVPVNVIVRRTS